MRISYCSSDVCSSDLLRVLQGLALGGEYGGAAIYVAEHSPPGKRGFYTSFIQASVVGGFVLSLIVVLGCKALMPDAVWESWGWRVPFLLSLILLATSLWMRLNLSESPVFQAMKEEGELADRTSDVRGKSVYVRVYHGVRWLRKKK